MTTIDERGRLVVDVLVTLSNGETREFRIRENQTRRIGDLIDDLGTDAPPLVGSPRTMQRFVDAESAEFEDPDDFTDYGEAVREH